MSDPISSLVQAVSGVAALISTGTGTAGEVGYLKQQWQPTPPAQVQPYHQQCPALTQPVIVQNPDGSYAIQCQQRQP